MSESNGYATLADIEKAAEKPRRFRDIHVPGLGKLRCRSGDAFEYTRVQAALKRATMAANEGKLDQHDKLLDDAYNLIATIYLVDGEGNQFITVRNSNILSKLDGPVRDFVVEEILDFVGTRSLPTLEDSAKN